MARIIAILIPEVMTRCLRAKRNATLFGVRILSGALLLLCLGGAWYFVRNDIADYSAFKLLTETAARQRRYRVWALKSFLVFSGLTVICLATLGRLRGLTTLPPEFHALSESIPSILGHLRLPTKGFVARFGAALLVVFLITLLVRLVIRVIAKKALADKPKLFVFGDIEPLMPRNWQESAHAALLALNAGLSEELFFRLLLPLLVTLLLGNALFGFVVATLIFGAIHFYQGPVGVVATTVLGFVFVDLYLWTGNLWVAVCAHILSDMIGLVIRPAIATALQR
jgi:membrane protease YdiL (CAAX protease family)